MNLFQSKIWKKEHPTEIFNEVQWIQNQTHTKWM